MPLNNKKKIPLGFKIILIILGLQFILSKFSYGKQQMFFGVILNENLSSMNIILFSSLIPIILFYGIYSRKKFAYPFSVAIYGIGILNVSVTIVLFLLPKYQSYFLNTFNGAKNLSLEHIGQYYWVFILPLLVPLAISIIILRYVLKNKNYFEN